MELLKKKEINAQIGKRGVFATLPDLIDKVRYENGIPVFDSIQAKIELGHVLSFIGHPEGIEIKISATGEAVVLHYSDISYYDIHEFNEKRYLLEITRNKKPTLNFNFLIDKATDIAQYFYTIKVDRYKEERPENVAKEEIELLVNAYAPSKLVDFNQEIKSSALGKVKRISIEEDRISWAGEVFDLKESTGICYSKTETSVSGFKASMEYRIHIHWKAGKPLKIVFGKSFGIGEKEAELLYNNILDALFERVVKNQIYGWLQKLAKNERAKISDLELSRTGISYYKKETEVLIPWEHLSIESFEMNLTFKSRMNIRHAFYLGLPHNPEAWPLLNFCEYIMTDINRLKLITG